MDKNARTYLQSRPLSHVDMIAVLSRATAEVVAESDMGVLLYEKSSRAYMLSAADLQTAQSLIDHIEWPRLMTVHQDFIVDMAARRFGLQPIMKCFQARWPHREPPIAVSNPEFIFRALEEELADEVSAIYSHDMDTEYIRGRIAAREMFGAFSRGRLAGFIGVHEEGSMGMLEVLPAFRRQGVGSLLLSQLCAHQLSRGRIPYSQFVTDNIASEQLHRRLGFDISQDYVYWLEE